MKKTAVLLLSALCLLCVLCLTVFSAAAKNAAKPSVSKAQKTDIRAYIDDAEIPAYNIGGSMMVCAADLVDHGFSVEFTKNETKINGKTVSSSVMDGQCLIRFSDLRVFGEYRYDNAARRTTLRTAAAKNAEKPSVSRAQKTDIRAYIDNTEIPSYNIGGSMMICAADLVDHGFSVEFTKNETTINGQVFPFTAMDGHRLIRFSDLRVFGEYRYDNAARRTTLRTDAAKMPAANRKNEKNPAFPDIILHAGGVTPKGKKGSNSMEALEYSYIQGYRYIEIDFAMTSDGELACVHDWQAYYPQKNKKPPTMKRFLEEHDSVYGFTSLSADILADWMRTHPDVYIVTDTKEDNLTLAEKLVRDYPDLCSRFIVQIYSADEYTPVQRLGFDKIIYTLYRLTYREKYDLSALTEFVRNHPGLLALTFAADEEKADFTKSLCSAVSVPVFTHTINDAKKVQFWKSLGVDGVYADYPPA